MKSKYKLSGLGIIIIIIMLIFLNPCIYRAKAADTVRLKNGAMIFKGYDKCSDEIIEACIYFFSDSMECRVYYNETSASNIFIMTFTIDTEIENTIGITFPTIFVPYFIRFGTISLSFSLTKSVSISGYFS